MYTSRQSLKFCFSVASSYHNLLLASPSNQVATIIIWMKDQDATSKQLDKKSDEDKTHLTTITIHMYANLKKI